MCQKNRDIKDIFAKIDEIMATARHLAAERDAALARVRDLESIIRSMIDERNPARPEERQE